MAEQNAADLISLPPGGGAVRSIGETFQPDLHTGTGSLHLPLEVPPGRGRMTPMLALTYSSGNGNGPLGLGWDLAVPSITRKTDKRIPTYGSADVFVLSGAEDLVPVRGGAPGVQRYRPQTESLFARIEHCTSGSDHWQVWTKDGMRHTYGTARPAGAEADWTDPAAIIDPEQPGHVFGWLLSASTDTFGSNISYRYQADPLQPAGAQRYLAAICYGDHETSGTAGYLVEIRFVLEPRFDRHTHRRAGFPVTTGARYARIETWMHAATDLHTRTVALHYDDGSTRLHDNGESLLRTVSVIGEDPGAPQPMPPMEFAYGSWDPLKHACQVIDGTPPV